MNEDDGHWFPYADFRLGDISSEAFLSLEMYKEKQISSRIYCLTYADALIFEYCYSYETPPPRATILLH